jgi:acyl-coenzyme A synthetase/AMP-(fatty) acid ligase
MTADLQFLHQASSNSCLEDLRAVGHAFPDLPALVHDELTQTYSELVGAWEATRRWLEAQGIPPSCRVLLLAPNLPETIWLHLALLGNGALSALVDVKTNREALLLIGQDFLPSVVLCTPDQEERAAELLRELPPRTLLVTTRGLREQVGQLSERAATPLSREGRVVYYRVDREDHWRGAVFGLPQLGATCRQVRQLFSLHLGNAVLCQMSTAHYLSLSSMILPALCSGGKLLLLGRECGADGMLDAIAAHQPQLMIHYRKTYWFLHRAAQQRREEGRPLGRLLHAVVNADSPHLPFRASWEDLFQGHLLAGFATTFAGSFLSLNLPWLEDREGFVGKALPGVELHVQDETGAERPTGRWGEVLFRSPGMACEFLGDEHLNPELGEDGWLRSQQMAMQDTDGFLTLADEVFDVIWVYGFKVSPLEIEEPVRELPGVVDAAAVNAPRATHPDQVHLYVQVAEDAEGRPAWSERTLLARCDQLFPPYLRPTQIFVVDEIPHDDEEFKLRKELKYRTPTADLWRSS